ncbi:MAG: hypothetical protein C4518_01045 [Desulfobacteraceae bacterium]|nr:MAG: hypothetical protein C4518_01045 [Desulfobacteraceae bacterium]
MPVVEEYHFPFIVPSDDICKYAVPRNPNSERINIQIKMQKFDSGSDLNQEHFDELDQYPIE